LPQRKRLLGVSDLAFEEGETPEDRRIGSGRREILESIARVGDIAPLKRDVTTQERGSERGLARGQVCVDAFEHFLGGVDAVQRDVELSAFAPWSTPCGRACEGAFERRLGREPVVETTGEPRTIGPMFGESREREPSAVLLGLGR
jgi:hypothetical protein